MIRLAIATVFTILAAALFVAGGSVAQGQMGGKACVYDGQEYQPGDSVCVQGVKQLCHGTTGTWLPSGPCE